MMQKIIKCGIVGGFILFVWSAVFWMFFACQTNQMLSFANERSVASVIAKNAPKSGIYMLPNLATNSESPNQLKEAEERMAAGPLVYASVCLEGKSPRMGKPMLWSLILKVVAASLVTWLLLQTRSLEFKKSVRFITVVSVVVAILLAFPKAIWFGFPGSYVVCTLVETIVGWFLAGLAIAKVAK